MKIKRRKGLALLLVMALVLGNFSGAGVKAEEAGSYNWKYSVKKGTTDTILAVCESISIESPIVESPSTETPAAETSSIETPKVETVLCETAEASIVVEDADYTGEKYEGASVKYSDNFPDKGLEIKYYKEKESTELIDTPINAGTYTAKISKEGATAKKTFSINKIIQNAKLTMQDYTFGENPTTPSVTDVNEKTKITYYYDKNGEGITNETLKWENIGKETLQPGTYYMYAVLEETTNYKKTTINPVKFEVKKAAQTPTATPPTATPSASPAQPDTPPIDQPTPTPTATPEQTLTPTTAPSAAPTATPVIKISQSPISPEGEYFAPIGKEVELQITVENADSKNLEYQWYMDGKKIDGNSSKLTVKLKKKGTVIYTCDIYNKVTKETKKTAGSWKVTGYNEKVSITYKKTKNIKDIFGKKVTLSEIKVPKKAKKALTVNAKNGTIKMKKYCKNVKVTLVTKEGEDIDIVVSTVYPKPVVKVKKGAVKTYVDGRYCIVSFKASNAKGATKIMYEYSKKKKNGYKKSKFNSFYVKEGNVRYFRAIAYYGKQKSPYSKVIKIKG